MEDIIVDGPTPTSIKSRKSKNVRRIKPKRDFTVYLFDWLVKGLMVALLFAIDFALFASAGNFEVYSSGFTLSSPVIYVFAALAAVSLLFMFLISFSSFLQNILASFMFAVFVYIVLNQFALFDKYSYLAYWAEQYLGADVAMKFMGNSDIVTTIAAGVVAFIFLAMTEKKNVAYFTGILIVIFGGILADEYFDRNNHKEFKVVYDNNIFPSKDGKKFIYIMLPNAGSISYLEDMKEINSDKEKVQKTMDIMLGFFAKNDFYLYPNAYVNEDDAFMNMAKSFNNLSDEEAKSFLASSVSMSGHWSFKNLNDEYVYMNQNQLYDVFKKAKYKISAYKSRGADMCTKNGYDYVDRCVEKINSPISFDSMNISSLDKTYILVVQWLESMGLFQNLKPVYTMLKAATNPDNLPMVGIKYSNLYVVDSPKTLDVAVKDIIKDKGNQAYFIFMDLPSNMFVYNEYCRVNNTSQWLDMESQPWVVNKNLFGKRTAYLNQTACLYGKLEQFMRKLKEADVLDKSVVVVQGLSGVDDLKNVNEKLFIPVFKNKNLVTMAIRDPLKKQFTIGNEVCSAPDILSQYLFKRGMCKEMHNLGLHIGAQKELKGMLNLFKPDEKMTENALKVFDIWYDDWLKVNDRPMNIQGGVVPLPKLYNLQQSEEGAETATEAPEAASASEEKLETEPQTEVPSFDENAVVEEVSIGEVKVMDKPISEEAESVVDSLSKAVAETPKDNEPEILPLSKP